MKVQKDLPVFYAKKSLGQNFLISEAIAQKIAEASLAEGDCGVIEIGPAYGALTKKLAPLFKKVIAIEIDEQLILQLERNLLQNNINNVKIIHGDILKQDMSKIIKEEFANLNVVVAANLPYYISTPIIMNLLKPGLGIKAITVMLQKELAERFCAKPGTKNTGAITQFGIIVCLKSCLMCQKEILDLFLRWIRLWLSLICCNSQLLKL